MNSENMYTQRIENLLCKKLMIPSLKPGNIVLRDSNNWRINEKEIEYSWLINVSRSFIGWCWLFSIKFNTTKFREKINPEELIQGIFTVNDNTEIEEYYAKSQFHNFIDKIREIDNLDLTRANDGITLDGVQYEYTILSKNLEVEMKINNPNTANWKNWENTVWELGLNLSKELKSSQIQKIFK